MYYAANSKLSQAVHDFVIHHARRMFSNPPEFKPSPIWQALHGLGTQLWLDSGNIENVEALWSSDFSALTTNNTLLNKEVQTGRYDDLVLEAAKLLDDFPDLTERQRLLEIAFILNAVHGLRLVSLFKAFVSVEEHTDLAHDIDAAVEYAKRYHAIHPTRFIVKIPFTPEGLLATRKISAAGITVNHTLNFSARQNYLIARIGQPAFVNVFLGRLNSFVKSNELGDGAYVGEKAVLASQSMLRQVRQQYGLKTQQIGASFRSGQQVVDLMGLDVMTMPPKVAAEFLELGLSPDHMKGCTGNDYTPGVDDAAMIEKARLDTLWDIPPQLEEFVDALEKKDLNVFDGPKLIDAAAQYDCGDVLVNWSDARIKTSRDEGKIPKLENWQTPLASKEIGLDALMNLAGLNSFCMDQDAMDRRVENVLASR